MGTDRVGRRHRRHRPLLPCAVARWGYQKSRRSRWRSLSLCAVPSGRRPARPAAGQNHAFRGACHRARAHALPRDLLFVPVDDPLPAGADGQICQPRRSETLDRVLATVAERYRGRAGAIVFSGIGLAGADGAGRSFARAVGCGPRMMKAAATRTLPHYIREVCDVSLSAAPEVLAEHLARPQSPSSRPS